LLEKLVQARKDKRPKLTGGVMKNNVPYPEAKLSYLGNVLNSKAEAFYKRHGVTEIEPAAESGLDMQGRKVMTTRYCLLHQLDMCRKDGNSPASVPPLYLTDTEGHKLELRFDCARCEMHVYYGGEQL
jgi:putative protease